MTPSCAFRSALIGLACAAAILTGANASPAGENYAFLVAVRTYDETELNSLSFTENDIEALAKVLRQGGYPDENITVLTQGRGAERSRFTPTANHIRQELKLLLSDLERDDSVLVAFSGHGVQFKDVKGSYFCPSDARLADRATLVSLAEVYQLLDSCHAASKVLFVDACRNEPQSKVSKANREIELAPAGVPQDQVPPGGIAAFYSCSAGQKSYEHPELEHGVFFHYVIEGLAGKADTSTAGEAADSEISLAELLQYTRKKVKTFARTRLGHNQQPELVGEDRGLVLANVARAPSEPSPPPAVVATPTPKPDQPVPSEPTPKPGRSAPSQRESPVVASIPRKPRQQFQAGAGRTDEQVIADIDRLIRQAWSGEGISPSPRATDGEWCRRVYLDVLGRIPTVDETSQFLRDTASDKKHRLVDRLLDSDDYQEHYARNWTTVWTNVLIGRTGGTERAALASREGLQHYLRTSFLENKPYDELAFELISADGAAVPEEEGYNGAVNFILDNLAHDALPATARTARIFLGLQIQCVQCHNHPFMDSKQEQFWNLNAFFRQAKAIRKEVDGRSVVLLEDQDFPGEGGNPQEADIFYEQRNGLLKVAYPTFIDGTGINRSGLVDAVNRRDELASLVTESRELSTALVNRMWEHFFTHGFTRPVDDMGPHDPPSHPELLDRLALDCAARGYDLKSLVGWITKCEAYSLSSRFTSKNEKDDPARGAQPLFSRFYPRQMTAEQVYESLAPFMPAPAELPTYEARERDKAAWMSEFFTSLDNDENEEQSTFDCSVGMALLMQNGPLTEAVTSSTLPGSFMHSLLQANPSTTDALDRLYLAALSRKPTREESAIASQVLKQAPGTQVKALSEGAMVRIVATRADVKVQSDVIGTVIKDERYVVRKVNGDWLQIDIVDPNGKSRIGWIGRSAVAVVEAGSEGLALRDIFWVLLNSNEFILNH